VRVQSELSVQSSKLAKLEIRRDSKDSRLDPCNPWLKGSRKRWLPWVCTSWACTSLGLHFMDVYLMGLHLRGLHFMGLHLVGVVCLEAFQFGVFGEKSLHPTVNPS
jgi:hypothetical protein